MKLIIDATEVAEMLMECQPGDEEMITIKVTKNDGKTLEGMATEVEHVTGGEDYEEEGAKEEMPMKEMGGRRVPKAILMVASK